MATRGCSAKFTGFEPVPPQAMALAEARLDGMSLRAISSKFEVPVSVLQRWFKRPTTLDLLDEIRERRASSPEPAKTSATRGTPAATRGSTGQGRPCRTGQTRIRCILFEEFMGYDARGRPVYTFTSGPSGSKPADVGFAPEFVSLSGARHD